MAFPLISFLLTSLICFIIFILKRNIKRACCQSCSRKLIKKKNTSTARVTDSKNSVQLKLNQPLSKKKLKKLWLKYVISGNVPLAQVCLDIGVKFEGPEWESVYSVTYNIFRSRNRKNMLKLLLKHNLDVINLTEVRTYGNNLLHWFTVVYARDDDESIEIIKMLLKAGIPFDGVNALGFSPLFMAIMEEKMKLASFFIEMGADVNKNIKDGSSSLDIACWVNRCDFIELLVNNGADIYKRNIHGFTPLHTACIVNNEEIINYLLKQGANISDKNVDGETPFSLLDPRADDYELCLITMIKEFSKLSFENISVPESDMDLIRQNPDTSEHFDHCTIELALMSATEFYQDYTYYSLLNMKNMKKFADLMKNEEVVTNFKANLDCFFFYKDDLETIFEEIIELRDDMLVVDTRLKAVFADFLPETVMRELANYLSKQDLPLH